MAAKICTKCKIPKKLTEFAVKTNAMNKRSKPSSKLIYSSSCKKCTNEYTKEWQKTKKGKEAVRKGNMKYQNKGREVLSDQYIKDLLVNGTRIGGAKNGERFLTYSDITPDMVYLKRQEIIMYRLLNPEKWKRKRKKSKLLQLQM